MTLMEASRLSGIKPSTLRYRTKHGWPKELLFVKPDYRNRYMISKTVGHGIDLQFGTEKDSA